MSRTLISAAVLCAALTLAGCSQPPKLTAPDPVLIEHEKTLDRVHIRDDSAEFYAQSRGGAAVRQEEASQVLWNEHYVADMARLEAKRQAELAAQEKARRDAEEALKEAELRKAKEEALAKQGKAQRDRSIYAKQKAAKADPKRMKDVPQPVVNEEADRKERVEKLKASIDAMLSAGSEAKPAVKPAPIPDAPKTECGNCAIPPAPAK